MQSQRIKNMTVFTDERPINPDKAYLQNNTIQITGPQIRQYLKKKVGPVLPCQLHQYQENKQKPLTPRHQNNKTKHQIYLEIKQKNRAKFGQKKPQQPKKTVEPAKLDAKKMTVGYKPKQVKIEIEQYKKPNYRPPLQKKVQKDAQKVEYKKLMQHFRQQFVQFEKQKEQFNKVASKLKFKHMIKGQDGLLYSKIKKQVQNRLIKTQIFYKENAVHHHSNEKLCTKQNKCSNLNPFQKLTKTFSVNQLKHELEKTEGQIRQVKDKLLNENYISHEHREEIGSLYLLPNFQLKTILEYIYHEELMYNRNSLYRRAIEAFNSKFIHLKNKIQTIEDGVQVNQNVKVETKVKFVGEKRVSKYAGWTEVWIPGRQRLMTNESYKVVWLYNGDVIQQYNKNVSTYYSKLKNILKIQIKDKLTFYYHDDSKQIWKELPNNTKEIVYLDGRSEIKTILQDP